MGGPPRVLRSSTQPPRSVRAPAVPSVSLRVAPCRSHLSGSPLLFGVPPPHIRPHEPPLRRGALSTSGSALHFRLRSPLPAPRCSAPAPSRQRRREPGGGAGGSGGAGGAGGAMWFLYALSWLSLLLQVAFVTLAIGERRPGGGEALRPQGRCGAAGRRGKGGPEVVRGASRCAGGWGVTWAAFGCPPHGWGS